MKKAEMLARINDAWQPLLATVLPASEAQLSLPAVNGWAAKDHLVHISAWEAFLIAFLEGNSPIQAFGLPPDTAWDIDAINTAIQARTRDQSVAEVMYHLGVMHNRLMALLERLNDADLGKPHRHFQPDYAGPEPDQPIINRIAVDAYEHYPEHLSAIQAALRTA